uniref:ALIX_LYPXL_bnd domain-containing protein n=1 Tax=Steinernema glaseri TaxID=37863 RepID=A0A1I7YFL1_9BILA
MAETKEVVKNMLALKSHRQARLSALKVLVEGHPLHSEYGIRDSMKRPLAVEDMVAQEKKIKELQNRLNSLVNSTKTVDECAVKRSEEYAARLFDHDQKMQDLMAVLEANDVGYEEFVKQYREKECNDRDIAQELAKIQAHADRLQQSCGELRKKVEVAKKEDEAMQTN